MSLLLKAERGMEESENKVDVNVASQSTVLDQTISISTFNVLPYSQGTLSGDYKEEVEAQVRGGGLHKAQPDGTLNGKISLMLYAPYWLIL